MEKRKAAKDDFENRKWTHNIRVGATIVTVDKHDVIYIWRGEPAGGTGIKMMETSYNGKQHEQLLQFIKSLDPFVEKLRSAAGAYETAEKDRSAICQLGELLLGGGKQCYSADAVCRAVKFIAEDDPPYFRSMLQQHRENEGAQVMASVAGDNSK